MNRNTKRIGTSLRPQIEIVKGYIRSAVRPFDGDGYTFTKAVAELRKAGWKISYDRHTGSYTNHGNTPDSSPHGGRTPEPTAPAQMSALCDH